MVNDDSPIQNLKAGASHIGNSMNLKGDISGSEDLVVEGQVNGKIDLGRHDLTIQKEGKIEADVQARNITVHGEVKGTLSASERVFISETGRMNGDISAARISIMDGAQFKGSIKMKKAET